MSYKRLIDEDALLEWLDVEIEMSQGRDPVLVADRWAFRTIKKVIESGRFDIPSNQGEASLKYALTVLYMQIAKDMDIDPTFKDVHLRNLGDVIESISSPTEDTGIQKVRELWESCKTKSQFHSMAMMEESLIAVGMGHIIKGIADGGDSNAGS